MTPTDPLHLILTDDAALLGAFALIAVVVGIYSALSRWKP